MRYQERIYEQINTFTRNKSVNIVNTSSDISVFNAPQFSISGATKVQCDDVQFTISGLSYSDLLMSTITPCLTSDLSLTCFNSFTWTTNIYANDSLVYTSVFYNGISVSDLPTDSDFIQSVKNGFINLSYNYKLDNSTFTLSKIPNIQNIKINLDIFANYDYTPPFTCPSDFTPNPNNDGCQLIITSPSPPIFNGSGTTIQAGDKNNDYSNYGTYFYDEILNLGQYPLLYNDYGFLTNSTGGTISPINISDSSQNNIFWFNSGTTTNGRLNNIGLSATTGSYVGFSKCLNIVSGGTYYIGLAADNNAEFRLNGELIVNLKNDVSSNFKIWSVFKVNLQSGQNIIEMLGENNGSAASFGAEIYNPINFSTLTGATGTGSTQANVIFSTGDYIGGTWDIGTDLGYSCPSGYALNTCGTAYTCTQILRASYLQTCTGNCSDNEVEVLNQDLPSINNESNGVYILDPNTGTTIPLIFNFTGNTSSFLTNNTTFNYEIYRFNPNLDLFVIPSIYSSPNFNYSAFSGTNRISQALNFSTASDGDYLIKGYTISNTGTKYLNALGKTINTKDYVNSKLPSFYNPKTDFYFVAIYSADKPKFLQSQSQLISNATVGALSLTQQIINVSSSDTNGYSRTGNTFTTTTAYNGDPIVTLNGLVLSKNYDYLFSGQVLTFIGSIINGDIITLTYNATNSTPLVSESIYINHTISSGSTNNQGINSYYYNTTTNKYEIYTQNIPVVGTTIMVILNGITLMNNIDYYQSTTNPNRIILNGSLMENDIIVVIYNPQASIINGVYENVNILNWTINHAPMGSYGQFDIEYSTSKTFSTYTTSSVVQYIPNVTSYSGTLALTGEAGTDLFYRVKNTKKYPSKCGDLIISVAYSEIVPITILTNKLNSY